MRRGQEVGRGVGRRGKAGGVRGGRVQVVKMGMEICCHVVGGDGRRGGVLCIRADQGRVSVNGEGLVLINDQRALGAAAANCAGSARLRPCRYWLKTRP